VKDTFVGNDAIRGVSGGQRRRVTVGEIVLNGAPILCGDEAICQFICEVNMAKPEA
jgi:ATP-binding cassette subfamily G (WHITE) protein 2 (PDR)